MFSEVLHLGTECYLPNNSTEVILNTETMGMVVGPSFSLIPFFWHLKGPHASQVAGLCLIYNPCPGLIIDLPRSLPSLKNK